MLMNIVFVWPLEQVSGTVNGLLIMQMAIVEYNQDEDGRRHTLLCNV